MWWCTNERAVERPPASVPEFVPVVIVGAGPAGITAATLLAQYGIDCLVLDRHETAYPLPRAVHADDEIYRILARLGIGDEFAAHSPARAGSSADRHRHAGADRDRAQHRAQRRPRVPADEHVRPTRVGSDAAGQPQALSAAVMRGNVEVTAVTQSQTGRVRVSFLDRVRGGEQSVQASYVLGCDGANSPTRAAIGAHMYGLPFTQELGGHRRGHRRRTQPVGGLPPAVQPPARRHLHASVRKPATAGNSGCSTARPQPTTKPSRRSNRWSGPGWATPPSTR